MKNESGTIEECPNCGYKIRLADVEDEVECPFCGEPIKFYTQDDRDGDSYQFTVTNIEWDVDDEDDIKHLPTKVVVDVPMECVDNGSAEVEDFISDYLSDKYGFTHNGFSIDGMDDDMMQESHNDIDNDPAYECPYCGGHNCEFHDAEDYPEEGYFDGSTLKTCFHCLDCEEYYQVEFGLNVKGVKSMKVQNRKGGRFR